MQDLARQLEAVRRRSRGLLVLRRVALGVAWLVAVFVVLGVVDYVLRLPGWLRLVVGLGVVAFGGWWWVSGLVRAAAFRPTLDELALRVERLYPGLAGLLGSALAFGMEPGRYAQPAGTAVLAQRSIARAQAGLAGVRVGSVIDYRPTRRTLVWALAAVAGLAVVAAAMPMHASTAARRWVMPLGDAAWPRWTGVSGADVGAVRPVDTPITFDAAVEKGYEPGMRVWLNWRWVEGAGGDGPGAVESMLLTEQPADGGEAEAGRYRGQWRPPAEAVRAVQGGAGGATLEYWFEAGDDATEPRRTTLVARPALESLTARVDPPAYAAGVVAPQSVPVVGGAGGGGGVASLPALAGSRVELTLQLNKALPAGSLDPAALVPGLSGLPSLSVAAEGGGDGRRVTVGFTLLETVQTAVRLTDEYGLTDAAERELRFETLEDQPPTVSITEPSADLSVLATAVVPVAARAGDDVALSRLTLDVEQPLRAEGAAVDGTSAEGASAEGASADSAASTERATLAERVARQGELAVEATLDLGPRGLRVGDEVTLHAVAADGFELDGRTHDPVEAAVRRLRIIDEGTLIDQVRGDLAGVRQQAVRLERQQAELSLRAEGDDAASLAGAQARLTRTVAEPGRAARRGGASAGDEPAGGAVAGRAGASGRRAGGACGGGERRGGGGPAGGGGEGG